MKLHLGCGDDIRLHDYVNVDILPNPKAPAEIYRQGEVTNLDWICAADQADEIMTNNVLACIPYAIVDAVLAHWVTRLKMGGVLKITAPDLHWIATALAEDVIDLATAMPLLYGGQNQPHNEYRSGIEGKVLCDRLVALGMRITVQRLAGYMIYIEAEKVGGN